jgi:hypothetical protein
MEKNKCFPKGSKCHLRLNRINYYLRADSFSIAIGELTFFKFEGDEVHRFRKV